MFLVVIYVFKKATRPISNYQERKRYIRIVFVIFALSSLINISFLYKLFYKLLRTKEEFGQDENKAQKSYAFDKVLCSSYFSAANSTMEFI
jgi:hypothetical protein